MSTAAPRSGANLAQERGKLGRQGEREALRVGVGQEAAAGAVVSPLSLEVHVHRVQVHVRPTARTPAVHVVAKVAPAEDEERDVGQGAQVDELVQQVVDVPFVEELVTKPLHKRKKKKKKTIKKLEVLKTQELFPFLSIESEC